MYRIAICDDDKLTVNYIYDMIIEKFGDQYKIFRYEDPRTLEFNL
jgi:hypothetical protein